MIVCHIKRASGGFCGLLIPFVIADEQRPAKIQVQFFLCLKDQPWLGLAAVTAFFPIVRAVVDRVYFSPGFQGFFDHASMDLSQIGLGHDASSKSRLVGNNHDAITVLLQ